MGHFMFGPLATWAFVLLYTDLTVVLQQMLKLGPAFSGSHPILQVPQNYTKANCTYCNTREYTFSYKGCCFYFTKKKHTWNGCCR